MTACGKRAGPSLMDTVRIDAETFKCPIGYEPCSRETSPSETVCWPFGKNKVECPILDILVISIDSEPAWIEKGY